MRKKGLTETEAQAKELTQADKDALIQEVAEEVQAMALKHLEPEDVADTYVLKGLHRILDIPAKRQIIAIGTYHREDGTIDGLEFKVLKNGVHV